MVIYITVVMIPIVANDFTQVLSDGIGAWITNLGRAELVS